MLASLRVVTVGSLSNVSGALILSGKYLDSSGFQTYFRFRRFDLPLAASRIKNGYL